MGSFSLYLWYGMDGQNGTIVNITGSTFLQSYDVTTPELDVLALSSSMRDGGEIYRTAWRNVTETIETMVYGNTKQEVHDQINEFEKVLNLAARRQRLRAGEQVFLHFNTDDEVTVWRSEVLAGRVELVEGTLAEWANVKATIRLHITRRFYWETTTDQELKLKNGSVGSYQVGGVTIYNHDDGTTGHDNWVDIQGSGISGMLPTPIKVVATYTGSSNLDSTDFWLALNNVDTSIQHVIEGETSTSGGTVVSDSTASNGQAMQNTWSGAVSGGIGYTFTLSGAELTKLAGHYYRILARFSTPPASGAGVRMYPAIGVPANPVITTLAQGGEVSLDGDELVDLGVLPLPPGLDNTTYSDMGLFLHYRADAAGSMSLDFLHLSPAHSTLHLKQNGYYLVANDLMVVDGIRRLSYIDFKSPPTGAWPILRPYGDWLYVWPGEDHRLTLLVAEGSTAAIDLTMKIQVYYRPRRLTV